MKLGKIFRKAKKVAESDEGKVAIAVAEAVLPVKLVKAARIGKLLGLGRRKKT